MSDEHLLGGDGEALLPNDFDEIPQRTQFHDPGSEFHIGMIRRIVSHAIYGGEGWRGASGPMTKRPLIQDGRGVERANIGGRFLARSLPIFIHFHS
ncbi:hypothetical protein [Paraburkholderia sp.]|uniref:hypothetical protein n=1 Tax=Paraburkholderia sp. TaxID=1926495 RepID=UPI002ED13EB3